METGRVMNYNPNGDDDSAVFNAKTDEYIVGDSGEKMAFRRKVVRMVQKPFPKQKKVPVTTTRVVQCEVDLKVEGFKMVEYPDFEEVEETYTEYVEEKVMVPVKKWVEETVMEEYTEKIPVSKTRTVRKPVTKIVEEEDYQLVRVPGTKIIEVDGWRVDEIEDRKLVEVEEYEVYEFLPLATGKVVRGSAQDVGLEESNINRKTGTVVYLEDDLAETGIDFDQIEADQVIVEPVVVDQPVWGVSPDNVEEGAGQEQQQQQQPAKKNRRRRQKKGGDAGDSASV